MTNTPHGQVPEALEDFEVRKLAAIGAVRTSSGLVERRPIEYRRELEDQFVRGFRAAEKRISALSAATAEVPEYVGNGMFKGETIQKAAEHWANWCDVRCMTGLSEFLRVVAASPTPPAEQQAPSSAVLKAIREANMQLVRTGDDAFMLVPYKVATTEAVTPKGGATTGAALGGVYAELPAPLLIQYDEIDCEEFGCFAEGQMRDFADRTHALRMEQAAPKAAQADPGYSEKWDAELGRTAMRFVDRAGDVHPGIDDAETICAEFHKAMSEVIERMPHVQRMAAPQQGAQEPCPTCAALARTVMLDQVSFDRKPDCYGIRQITNDEGVEEWEDIRTSPDVAREEANDMMATGRGEIYEVVPLWTTPQPSLTAKAADSVLEDATRLDWLALAGPVSICVVIDRPHDGEVEVSTDDVTGYGKTLREAIDAAIAVQGGK